MRLYCYILFSMNIGRLLFSAQLATAPYCMVLPWESVFGPVVFERQGPLSLLPVHWWTDPVPMIARSSQVVEVPPNISDAAFAITRPFKRWYGIAEGRDEKDLAEGISRQSKDELYAIESAGFATCRHLAYIADDRSNCDFFRKCRRRVWVLYDTPSPSDGMSRGSPFS